MSPDERQRILDEEHMRLLAIGYFVSGGFHALFAVFPLIYVVMGGAMVSGLSQLPSQPGQPDVRVLGWIFVLIGLVFAFGLGLFAALQLWTGFNLRRRAHKVVCLVTAAISCLMIPYGTVLGVVTFLVLQRRAVDAMFGGAAAAVAAGAAAPSGQVTPPPAAT